VLLLRYAQKAVHSCFSWNAPITLLYWTMNYLYGGLLYQNADFVSWWNPKLVNRRSEKYGRFFSMLYYFKYARQLHEENCFKLWFHTNNNSKMMIDCASHCFIWDSCLIRGRWSNGIRPIWLHITGGVQIIVGL
jgi:hypothetical protein